MALAITEVMPHNAKTDELATLVQFYAHHDLLLPLLAKLIETEVAATCMLF